MNELKKKFYSLLEEPIAITFRPEGNIKGKINKFKKEHPEIEFEELEYESVALDFMEGVASTPSDIPEWGNTFYRPLMGNKDHITGKWLSYYPNIKNIPCEMVDYWEKRAKESKSPILQCRYSGLVWDFSMKTRNKRPDVSIVHIFIDSIVTLARLGGKDSFLKYKIRRALEIAVSIKDQNRINLVRDAIIAYEDTHSIDNKPGTWGYSFDLLIGNKSLSKKVPLKQAQEDHIIQELERRLKKFSKKNDDINYDFNELPVKGATGRLLSYYNKRDDKENLKRVALIFKDYMLYIGKRYVGLVSVNKLEELRTVLLQYGFQKEARSLEPDIQIAQKESLKDLKEYTFSSEIPKEYIDNYYKNLDQGELSDALNGIAMNLIPDKKQSKKMVLEKFKSHPLHMLVSQSILDHEGRTVDSIDPIGQDLKGHIVREMYDSIKYTNFFHLKLGLEYLTEKRNLNTKSLSEHFFKCPFFEEKYHSIILRGLDAFFEKNHIACCSVLVPQIESVIRCLIKFSGGYIYNQEMKLRLLGDLLRDEIFTSLFDNLNKNIPDYFKIVLVDERGFNIRNLISHGYLPSEQFNENTSFLLIHLLLILSVFRKK